jgi:hypothetical protein
MRALAVESEKLKKLIAFSKKNGRVCPQPSKWNEFWQMLPNRKMEGAGWEPPLPLILAAWGEASDEQKSEVFLQHILWANEHGNLFQIQNFLRGLADNDWYCASE